MRARLLPLALPALLAACGDLPRPLEGHPGAEARQLLQPPPARLAVPTPGNALLPDGVGRSYAEAVTAALVAREVPAVAGPAHPGDWRLDLTAELHGSEVVPAFAVTDPTGKPQGSTNGPPVAASAWSAASPAVLQQEAAASGPAIATLLTSIDAARRQSDPNSLYNRPPRVLIAQVTGAPGSGNADLTREMKRQLPLLGEQVVNDPMGADFTVNGSVRTSPGPRDTTHVEIEWHIFDAQRHDLGKVIQLNDVPKGTLNGLWGDVALVITQQAAGGVKTVIDKQTGDRAKRTAAKP